MPDIPIDLRSAQLVSASFQDVLGGGGKHVEPTGDNPAQDWRKRFRWEHCCNLGRGRDGVEGAEEADGVDLCVVGQAGLVKLKPDLPSGEVRGLDWRAELARLVGLAISSTAP